MRLGVFRGQICGTFEKCEIRLNFSVCVQVEFQNESQQMVKSSELHHLDQELPKRVRARLVRPR